MFRKAQEEQAAYEAASKAVEKTKPAEIYFCNGQMAKYRHARQTSHVSTDNYMGGVAIKYKPGETSIYIATVGGPDGCMYCDVANIDAVIEALTLFKTGDIRKLPEGWVSE